MKLYYFAMYGRAEPIRLMLTAAGLEFEDVRITFDEWKDLKSDTEKFEYGCMPVLEREGKYYSQSGALLRFVGKLCNYVPTDVEDIYSVEKLLDLVGDFNAGLIKLHYTKDEDAKKKLFGEYLENFFPKYFGFFESHLKENSSKEFIVGDSYTIADFPILHILERCCYSDAFKEAVKPIVDNYPTLKEYFETRYGAMKDYFETRPVCPF